MALTKRQKKAEVVRIVWIDSIGDDARWITEQAAKHWVKDKLPEIVSVGFLVHEDDEQVAICGHISPKNRAGMWAIPKACIKKMERL